MIEINFDRPFQLDEKIIHVGRAMLSQWPTLIVSHPHMALAYILKLQKNEVSAFLLRIKTSTFPLALKKEISHSIEIAKLRGENPTSLKISTDII